MVEQHRIEQALETLWDLYEMRFEFIAASWQSTILDAMGGAAAREHIRQLNESRTHDWLRVVMAGVEHGILAAKSCQKGSDE